MRQSAQITILALSVVLSGFLGYALAPREAPGSVLMVDGSVVPIPPNCEVSLEIEETDNSHDAVVVHDVSGRAQGADLSTTVDSFASTFQVSAPELHINGSSSVAGEVMYKAKGIAAKGHMVIIFVGVLCVVGGVVCAAKWDMKLGTYVAVAGVALILVGVMLERFPWVALVLPLIGVAIVVYFWLRARNGGRLNETVDSLIDGITAGTVSAAETAQEFAAKNITSKIAKEEVLKKTS